MQRTQHLAVIIHSASETPTISGILIVQEAAEALIALGWPVTPADDDFDTWRIGYFLLTDDELIGLAPRRGIQAVAETVQ